MHKTVLHLCSQGGILCTWPLVCMSVYVTFRYGLPAWRAFWASKEWRYRAQWLAMGISLAYFGESLNDVYWAIAWTLRDLGLESAAVWINNGQIANLPFRNVFGLAGVYCHIRALMVEDDRQSKRQIRAFHGLLLVSFMLGMLHCGIIAWFA